MPQPDLVVEAAGGECAAGPTTVRLVTHLDVNDADIRRASDVLTRLLAVLPSPAGANPA